MCTVAATELLSSQLHIDAAEAGRLRAQAPVKPVPLGFGAMQQADGSAGKVVS
jgi:hypothetical protein